MSAAWKRRLTFLAFSLLFAAIAPGRCAADLLIYRIPGTPLAVTLQGRSKVNPGGTVTYTHSRGKLYFRLQNVQIIEARSTQEQFARRLRKAEIAGDVDSLIETGKWALHHGLLDEAKKTLSLAWKADPSDKRLRFLAAMMSYIKRPVAPSKEIEDRMRSFLGIEDMQVLRSPHFVLMHDLPDKKDEATGKTRPQMRIELLEKVYEAYFLKFAFDGKALRPPSEPMQVVLFAEHADYLVFTRRIDPSLKMAAGFYTPVENIAIYYDQGSTETYDAINSMLASLQSVAEVARRTRGPGAADTIRLANTLDLLLDIQRENEDIEVVSHECTHQLAANSGLIPRDSLFVRWTHEGLAAYFEAPKEAAWSGIGAVNEQRLAYYRMLESDPEHGSIKFLVTDQVFNYAASHHAVLAAYGQAWALTHFLMETRFEQLMDYYDKLAQIPEREDWDAETQAELLKTFTETFGEPETLEVEWRRYMRGLKTDMELLVEDG